MEEPMSEYGVAMTLARYRARKAVKQQLWDRGIKLSSVTPRDVTEWADAMIADQPQLLAAEPSRSVAVQASVEPLRGPQRWCKSQHIRSKP
jgi:hypothetical protein